jgi:hypothetical protein
MAPSSLNSKAVLNNPGVNMSNRVSKANNIKYALSGDDRYIAAVDPGETFVVECAINVK